MHESHTSKAHLNSSQFLQSTFCFKLAVPQNSFLKLHLCFNSTFLVCCQQCQFQNNKFTIKHVNRRGDTLCTLELEAISFMIGLQMMTDYQAIIATYYEQDQSFTIIQWNLLSNQTIKLKYKSKSSHSCKLMLFNQNKKICIIGNSSPQECIRDSTKLTLSVKVFQFPLLSKEDKPIIQYVAEGLDFYFTDQQIRLNNRSVIGWLRNKPTDKNDREVVDYSVVRILDFMKMPIKVQDFKLEPPFQYDSSLYSWYISDAWEVMENTLYTKCNVILSRRKFQKTKQQRTKACLNQLLKSERIYDYYWNFSTNKITDIIPEFQNRSHLQYADHVIQFSNSLRWQANSAYIPQYEHQFLWTGIPWKRQTYRHFDIYYVNVETNSVMFYREQKKQNQITFENGHQVDFPSFNPFVYLEYNIYEKKQFNTQQYQEQSTKQEVKIFEVRLFKVSHFIQQMAVIYGFFMSELIMGCDDDLMCNVIQLLHQNQYDYLPQLKWTTPKKYVFIKK